MKLSKEDKLWSKIIRLRANNACEKCGKKKGLNAHHFYGRRDYNLRWDVDNGFALCSGCHTFSNEFSAHQTPDFFTEWAKEYRGIEWYNRLRKKKLDGYKVGHQKPTREEEYIKLKKEYETIENRINRKTKRGILGDSNES